MSNALLFYVMTNVRRSRGYAWEVKVVGIFKKKGFVVTRLGGTTSTMPDVSAHNDDTRQIISIECKSTVGNSCLVPAEQVKRCIDWNKEWGLYDNKIVILAFKFGNKGTGKQREDKQYLKVWNKFLRPVDLVCGYDGSCKSYNRDVWLEDFKF